MKSEIILPLPDTSDAKLGGVTIVMIAIPFINIEMGKTEITRAQWQSVMGEGSVGAEEVDCQVVSWDDAQCFITRLNEITGKEYRLPSEAEWKFACLSGKNGGASISPASRKNQNAWGLYDLPGNVWEWVADKYDREHEWRVLLGGSWFSESGEVDRIASNPAHRFENFGFRIARTLP
jgi:formylglycine-generating enzyme required for sulfatase activity